MSFALVALVATAFSGASNAADNPRSVIAPSQVRAGDEIKIGSVESLIAACRRESRFEESAADVAGARSRLTSAVDSCRKLLAGLSEADRDRWQEFLHWDETVQEASARPPKVEAISSLRVRWESALGTWLAPQLADVAAALDAYACAINAEAAHETAEDHAQAWNHLADLLEKLKEPHAPPLKEIGAAIAERERLGQAPKLIDAMRQTLGGPELALRLDADYLRRQLSSKVDEPYQVRGVYAGSYTVGAGRMQGDIWPELLVGDNVGRWLLRYKGTSTARSTASESGTTVVSRTTTDLYGEQQWAMYSSGMAAGTSVAGAVSRVNYESVNAGGGPFRQRAATSRAYERIGQAQADSAADARRSLASRMNQAGAETAADFTRKYFARMRDPFTRSAQLPPTGEFSSDTNGVYGQWRWPHSLRIVLPPPPFGMTADLSVSVSSVGTERFLSAALGGKELAESELNRTLTDSLGMTFDPPQAPRDAPAEEKTASAESSERRLRFAANPCEIEIDQGQMVVRIHLAAIDAGDTHYPPMTAETVYSLRCANGRLVAVREGGFQTRVEGDEQSAQNEISGRQQALGLGVRRSLNRALPSRLVWPPEKDEQAVSGDAKRADSPLEHLDVFETDASRGWLQIALRERH